MAAQTLIPVFTGELNHQSVMLCNARELHRFLKVGKTFAAWIKNRIAEYEFEENQDFIAIFQNRKIGFGRGRTEYHLTLDTAKELAMVERNEQGRIIRRYFIECERQAMQAAFAKALPEVRKDYRALLLEGQSEPCVPYPRSVRSAINTRAWYLAMEAYAVLREHLRRRVSHRAVNGLGILNEREALRVVKEGDLSDAIAHDLISRRKSLERTARVHLRYVNDLLAELDPEEA